MGRTSFISEWVLNTRSGRVKQKIDEIRAQYPFAHSGYLLLSDTEYTNALAVPSTYRFLLRFIWAHNNTGVTNIIQVYDGSGVSVSMGAFHIAGSDTVFIELGDAVVFHSNVCVSNLASNVKLRVGGLLINSGPE